MGRRRGRSETQFDSRNDLARRLTEIDDDADDGSENRNKPADGGGGGEGFFACYLLTSLSPRHKSHTYIGFTVNPRRRIRQHNGEIRSGAWRTKRGRPWEMVLCIYGFPSNVSALQFEWAWQHPRESLAVRKAASNFTSLSGISNKIKIAYTMLSLPAWENLDLTVNLFSTKYMKYTAGCPKLPKKMKTVVSLMDELPCYSENQVLDGCNEDDDEEEDQEEDLVSTSSETINNHLEGDDYYVSGTSGDFHSTRMKHDDFRDSMNLRSWSMESLEAKDESFNYELEFANSTRSLINNNHLWADAERSERQAKANIPPESSQPCLKRCKHIYFETCREDPFDSIKQNDLSSRQEQSSPSTSARNVSLQSLLESPPSNVINLLSPPICLINSYNNIKAKKALGCTEIIDLTDSPMIIEL